LAWQGTTVVAIVWITGATFAGQTQRPAAPLSRTQVLADLVLANHIVTNEGAVDGLGHVSARAAGAPVFEIRRVPGAKGMLVTNLALGDALAATLGKASAVLMRGHGAVLVGSSIPEAVSHSIHLDLNAQMQMQAMALGPEVRYLSAEDGAPGFGPYDRHWEHWKKRLEER
jgi:hypothetical protein